MTMLISLVWMNTEEKIKQRCKEDQNAKPETVYYDEYSIMLEKFKDRWTMEEFSNVTKTYKTLKSSLYALLPRPPLPKSREEINLPFEVTQLKDAREGSSGIFHIFSTANNSIILWKFFLAKYSQWRT